MREKFHGAASEAIFHRRNEHFQRCIPDTDLKRSKVVVGFDTSSWLIARRVKMLGGKFVLDQSIGHPLEKERIFTELRERYPAWELRCPIKPTVMWQKSKKSIVSPISLSCRVHS